MATVYYKDHKSDKEYHIEIKAARMGGRYKVEAKFGPRGGTLTHVDLTRGKEVTYSVAYELYNKRLNEKLAKGYTYTYPDQVSELVATMKREIPGVYLFDAAWTQIARWVNTYLEEKAA